MQILLFLEEVKIGLWQREMIDVNQWLPKLQLGPIDSIRTSGLRNSKLWKSSDAIQLF